MAAKPAPAPAPAPPDGGYGWVILGVYVVNCTIIIQLIQVFSLVFKDVFSLLHISGTDAATILNTNAALSLMMGLFTGPILKTFGARKMAAVGVVFVVCGMFLTAYAGSFIEFLIYYGFITSAGIGLTFPATTFTFNSYFKARRSMATGIAMTCIGLAAIFLPHVISLLLREYGPHGTTLLLAGLALHPLVGACLLHPVAWHAAPTPSVKGTDEDSVNKEDEFTIVMLEKDQKGECKPQIPISSSPFVYNRHSIYSRQKSGESIHPLTSTWEASTVEVGRSVHALNATVYDGSLPDEPTPTEVLPTEEKKTSRLSRFFRSVVKFFDLDLLLDPVFVNIMLGVSFAFFAEFNFSVFLPFLFAERGFDTQEIATFLSTLAISDTLCRFLAPFLQRLFRASSRVMYSATLVAVIFARIYVLFCHTRLDSILVFVGLGITKGFRVVFYTMVIPDAVPIERLPSAQGLQSLVNGIMFVSLGPLMGVLRDRFGTYEVLAVICSALTAVSLLLWTGELIVRAVVRNRYKAVNTSAPTAENGATHSK